MTEEPPMVQELRQLVRDKKRYALEAYLFLYRALEKSQLLAGEQRHVSGAELLEGFRALAVDMFGPLTLMVMNSWGLKTTEDVGQMVFALVERELMGKTEDDKLEDFVDVFEFDEVFDPQRLMRELDTTLTPAPQPLRRDLPAAKRVSVPQRQG